MNKIYYMPWIYRTPSNIQLGGKPYISSGANSWRLKSYTLLNEVHMWEIKVSCDLNKLHLFLDGPMLCYRIYLNT